jgi:excisionase family DNA binding protein
VNGDRLDQLLGELAARIAGELARLQPHVPNDPATSISPWMSVEAAANYLDWPRQRLYKLTAAGAIPHYKHDGRLLFNRAELDHWLHQHAQPARRLDLSAEQS